MRFFFVVVLLLLSRTAVFAQEFGSTRPALFLNGQALRSVIRNPTPPRYGDGEEGGCIPSDEFRIELTELVRDASGRMRIAGVITNADPRRQDPPFVVVETRQGDAVRRVATAMGGRLDTSVETGEAAVLVLSLSGFRTLELDLGRLARLARRRP